MDRIERDYTFPVLQDMLIYNSKCHTMCSSEDLQLNKSSALHLNCKLLYMIMCRESTGVSQIWDYKSPCCVMRRSSTDQSCHGTSCGNPWLGVGKAGPHSAFLSAI